jgi:glycolate oxidase FAD binding subunit
VQDTTIDGFGPLPVLTPQSVSELREVAKSCAADGQAIYPVGGRTLLELGLPPSKPGVAVDLRGLDQVIDYPARDVTITVQAGITIAKLQALLAPENQQLPIDVPFADQATLGGAIATNASGPRRYGYGTLRDYVIGISSINDEGHEVKAGGRVVKNVAGYDLMKLHIGALGTLGIITQITLKLRPLPEEQRVFAIDCAEAQLESLLDMVHGSRTRLIGIELLSPMPTETGKWRLLVGIEGNCEAVAWQGRQLGEELRTFGQLNPRAEASSVNGLWQSVTDQQVRPEASMSFKANLLPRATAAFCRAKVKLRNVIGLQAHAGNGIVIGHFDDLTLEQARTMLTTLLDAAGPTGNVVVTRCPTQWKRELPIWGKPRGDVWLMRRVKEKLDPRNVFNPGRFVDGI